MKENINNIKKFEDFGSSPEITLNSQNAQYVFELDKLIEEVVRVRDIFNGKKVTPIRTEYLNKILNFYAELKRQDFDFNNQTK